MNIIELANKAGFRESGATLIIGIDAFLERFATLVRAEYETPLKLAEEALQHAPSVMTKEALAAIREALADHSGDGNEMVAEQPNLNCPSVQARLAKVWGHVKAEPVKQEPVTNLFDVKKKAFEQLRLEVKAPDDKWTVGESINFFGFYSHGFDAGIKYANSVQPVKQEPVAWKFPRDTTSWTGGWTIDYKLIRSVDEAIEDNEFKPCIESIEEVLLALEKVYAAPVDAKAIRAEALEDAVKFLEENGMIAPNGFTAAGIRGLK